VLLKEERDRASPRKHSGALGVGMGRCEIRDAVKLSVCFVFRQSWKHSWSIL